MQWCESGESPMGSASSTDTISKLSIYFIHRIQTINAKQEKAPSRRPVRKRKKKRAAN